MMSMWTYHELPIIFGILGDVVSFVVFLAPIPTFYKIYKKKSSEGYQSMPYAVALFSAILLLYYGSLKTDGTLIITINSFGCAIELIYLITYLIYAPTEAKIFTVKLLVLFNLGTCTSLVLLSSLLAEGSKRVMMVGWICAVINICVFAAPLTIMRQVIKTKSVEFMPFPLSFLTLTATVWFLFIRDYFIAVPNIIGFLLGLAQMTFYGIYRNSSKKNVSSLSKQEGSPDLTPNLADDTAQIEFKGVEDCV